MVRVRSEDVGDGYALDARRLRPVKFIFEALEEVVWDVEVALVVPLECLVDERALIAVEDQRVELDVLDLEDLSLFGLSHGSLALFLLSRLNHLILD